MKFKLFVRPYSSALALILVSLALFTGCGPTKDAASADQASNSEAQSPDQAVTDPVNPEAYVIDALTYEDADRQLKIRYPQISSFPGELLQDYMNQSLKNPVETLMDDTFYTDLEIDFKVTRKDNEILSVLLTGTGKLDGERAFNYMNSVNLDLKTSNEITFDNFIKEDQASRMAVSELLDNKAKEAGLLDGADYEGLRLYFEKKDVIFYYMPLDDSAEDFVELRVPLAELDGLIESEFGPRPAS